MNKKSVFLAAPISAFSDELEYNKYRDIILSLISYLRKYKFDLFSEVEIVTDKKDYDSPAKSLKEDCKKIDNSDVFILFHPKKSQTSSFIELGYAFAKKKKIIIISQKHLLPYLALGIPDVCNTAVMIDVCDWFDFDYFIRIKESLSNIS